MPFLFVTTPPHDLEGLALYQKLNSESVPAFLAHGIKPIVVYGAIILQFPSMADAKAWYESPEYQNALPRRLKAASYRAFLIEGV